jgi:hypothetical protein
MIVRYYLTHPERPGDERWAELGAVRLDEEIG